MFFVFVRGFIYWSQFFYIRAHNVLWNDINNQLINHIIDNIYKFSSWQIHKIHEIILYFVDVKERKDQTESVQRIRI